MTRKVAAQIITRGVDLGDGGREGLCKGELPVLGRSDDGELGGAVVRHPDVCHHSLCSSDTPPPAELSIRLTLRSIDKTGT